MDNSYQLYEMLRKGLRLTQYIQGGELNTIVRFETQDGKVHEVCHSTLEVDYRRQTPALFRGKNG